MLTLHKNTREKKNIASSSAPLEDFDNERENNLISDNLRYARYLQTLQNQQVIETSKHLEKIFVVK